VKCCGLFCLAFASIFDRDAQPPIPPATLIGKLRVTLRIIISSKTHIVVAAEKDARSQTRCSIELMLALLLGNRDAG
jgi:hypothetical protein